MDINEIEIAARKAWPALEEMETPYGVLRFAGGVSRRTNSMNPVFNRSFDPQDVIRSSEQFFAARQLPSIVRVVAPRGQLHASHYLLDAALSESGYVTEAPTLVMVRALCESRTGSGMLSVSREVWLDAWHRVKSIGKESLELHSLMLSRVTDACRFLVHCDSRGRPLATAMAVCNSTCLGLFGVATTHDVRRQGLAQSLVSDLLAWGAAQGASYAYLQVESANTAARNLYEKNGFKELYTYWYRSKPLADVSAHFSINHSAQEIRS